jgi:hypothetical protein
MTEAQYKLVHDEAAINTRQEIVDMLRSPEGRDRVLARWNGDTTVFDALIAEILEMSTSSRTA